MKRGHMEILKKRETMEIIEVMYNGNTNIERINNEESKKYVIKIEVKQRYVLSL